MPKDSKTIVSWFYASESFFLINCSLQKFNLSGKMTPKFSFAYDWSYFDVWLVNMLYAIIIAFESLAGSV